MCISLVSPVLSTGGLLVLEPTCDEAVGLGKLMCYVRYVSRGGCRLLCLLCCEGSKQVCIFLVYHVFHTGGLLVVKTACGKTFALNLRV